MIISLFTEELGKSDHSFECFGLSLRKCSIESNNSIASKISKLGMKFERYLKTNDYN